MIINKMPHIPKLILPPAATSEKTGHSACCRSLNYEDTNKGPSPPTSLSTTPTSDEKRGYFTPSSPSVDEDPATSPVATGSPRPGSSCYALIAAVANLTFWDDFEAEKIGSGFFSDVYKIRHHGNGNVMVVKISKSRNNRQNQQKMLQELELLNKLNHPNIVRYLGACVKDGHIHPLLELISGGPLEDVLKDDTMSLSWQQKASLATDIARGMEYLHSRNICHRDLKSENCLVRKLADEKLEAVVADFGLARVVSMPDADDNSPAESPRRMSLVGSAYWMAPEILRGEEYTKTVDVFSFGIILCEIMARITADPDDLPRTNLFGLDVDAFRKMCPDCPADMLQIADDCCSMDPTQRPSFTEIYHRLCHISHRLPTTSSSVDLSNPEIPDDQSSHLVKKTDNTNSDCNHLEDGSTPSESTTQKDLEDSNTMQTCDDSPPPTIKSPTHHELLADVQKLAPETIDQSKYTTRVRRALYVLSAFSVLSTLCMLGIWRSRPMYTLVSVLVPLTVVGMYRMTLRDWWRHHQMTRRVTGILHTLGRRLSWGKLPPPPPPSSLSSSSSVEEKRRRVGRSGINMLELKSRKSNNNEREMNCRLTDYRSDVDPQDGHLADDDEPKSKQRATQDSDTAPPAPAPPVADNHVPLKLSRDMSSFGEGSAEEEDSSPPSVIKMKMPKGVLTRRRLSRPLIRPGSFGIHDSIEEGADEGPG